MKISVITVCRNSAATIRATFDSVLGQDWTEYEYLVVDGGSSDGTLDVIREYEAKFAGRLSWTSEPDRGIYDAINKGIRRATGDVIGLLHSNDRFEDGRVLADIAEVFRDESLQAVYGDIRFEELASGRTTRYYSSARWRPWMHSWGFMPAHPSVYVRRDVFDKCGLYHDDYRISGDFEWMTRVFCRQGIRAKYLPRCMVAMEPGGASTTFAKKLLLNRENVRGNRENGYFCILPMMLPKYVFKAIGLRRKYRK